MGLLQPDVGYRGRRRQAGLSGTRKAITVHSLRQARAAVAAAVDTETPVLLLSAPSAAASTGPAWFTAVSEAALAGFAGARVEPVLDCGALPGHALAAIRHGLKTIRYDGPSFDAIAEIAAQHGTAVLRERPPSLDLGDIAADEDTSVYLEACRRWLRSTEGSAP